MIISKKDWAIANSISPVVYLYNDSQTSKILNKLYVSIARYDGITNLIKNKLDKVASLDFLELLFYCKVYEGNMWRDNVLKEKITFYNEREWRYVPKLTDLMSINSKVLISKEEFDDLNTRLIMNNLLSNFKIEFTPKDIKYIIISKENERIKMVQLIEEIKGNDFTLNELKELSSKIISVEQIKDDF